jgi:hypothetical protein
VGDRSDEIESSDSDDEDESEEDELDDDSESSDLSRRSALDSDESCTIVIADDWSVVLELVDSPKSGDGVASTSGVENVSWAEAEEVDSSVTLTSSLTEALVELSESEVAEDKIGAGSVG